MEADIRSAAKKQILQAYNDQSLHPTISGIIFNTIMGQNLVDISLAVEGGAMRTAVTGWQMAALEEIGHILSPENNSRPLVDCFKYLFGVSGGAGAVGYAAALQKREGKNVFDKHMAQGSPFISLSRFLNGRGPLVSLDYCYQIMDQIVPINYPQVQSRTAKPVFIATHLDHSPNSNPQVYLEEFNDRADFIEAMCASARMPIVSGWPRQYKQMTLIDGYVLEPIPIYSALQRSKNALVLISSPENAPPSPITFEDKFLMIPFLHFFNPTLAKLYLERRANEAEILSFLREKQRFEQGPQYVATLSLPKDYPPVSRSEQNPKVLIQAGQNAANETFKAFGIQNELLRLILVANLDA